MPKRNDLQPIMILKFQAIGTENIDTYLVSSQVEILMKIVLLNSLQWKIIVCVLECVVTQMIHIDVAYVTIHAAYVTCYTVYVTCYATYAICYAMLLKHIIQLDLI